MIKELLGKYGFLQKKKIKVIDTNQLQGTTVVKFLSESPKNFVALTEYAAMETYKSDSLGPVVLGMKNLAKYSDRILVLKNTIDICCLRLTNSNDFHNLIDTDQTQNFLSFCNAIQRINAGDITVLNFISENREAAIKQLSRMRNNAATIHQGLTQTAKLFTNEQLKEIRVNQLSMHVIDKLIKHALTLSIMLTDAHPSIQKRPAIHEMEYSFSFKQAICVQSLFLRWVRDGRQPTFNADKVLNDLVDINFCTCALFFDGIITSDEKLKEIYRDSKILIGIFRNEKYRDLFPQISAAIASFD